MGGLVEIARDIGAIDEDAHQDEKRHHRQIVVGGVFQHLTSGEGHRRPEAALKRKPREPDEKGGKADPDAEKAERQDNGESDEGGNHGLRTVRLSCSSAAKRHSTAPGSENHAMDQPSTIVRRPVEMASMPMRASSYPISTSP